MYVILNIVYVQYFELCYYFLNIFRSDTSHTQDFSRFLCHKTGRLTEEKIGLNETEINLLNDKINFIQANSDLNPIVSITYFVPAVRKDGGSYSTVIGTVKRIDTYEKSVIMTDGNIIPIEDILQIEREIFKSFDE